MAIRLFMAFHYQNQRLIVQLALLEITKFLIFCRNYFTIFVVILLSFLSSILLSFASSLILVTSSEMHSRIVAADRHLVVLNVWATWCEPCKKEFPDLLKIRKKWRSRGVELIFLSADFKSQVSEVEKFLQAQKVRFPTYLKNEGDDAFINGISKNWSGALPVTIFYGPGGKYLDIHQGEGDYDLFDKKIRKLLKMKIKGSKK